MVIEAAEPLVTGDEISAALGGGSPPPAPPAPAPAAPAAAPPAAPNAAPVAPAPEAATPASPPAPETPADAELEIAPGRKVRASELTAWEASHKSADQIKDLMALDRFLARPENKELGDAIVGVLKAHQGNPAMVTQILSMVNGAPAAPVVGGPPANPLMAIESNLDLTDPSVKALYEFTKGLQAKMGEFETKFGEFDRFRATTQTNAQKSEEAQQISDAQTRLQGEMDTAWKTHQYDALLERVAPAVREQTGKLLKSMILTVAGLPGPNQVPIAQVAKTLHGQMSQLIEGVITSYVDSKQAPPAGGGRGPVSTPPVQADLGSEQMQAEIVEGLKTAAAVRA